MKTKKIIASFMVLASMFMIGSKAEASGNQIDKPIFAYGESLKGLEKTRTRKTLGVSNDADEIPVFTRELNDLLHDDINYHQVYSSVYVDPKDTDGIEVEIVTPDTITQRTENQYRNAAITAGATKVNIKIASVIPVDGSGALAGLYKVYRENGFELEPENIQIAQEELTTLSEIKDSHDNNKEFSDDRLNGFLAKTKEDILENKNEPIINIINNNIEVFDLQDTLTEEDINKIITLMEKFKNIDLTDEQKKSLKDLTNDLVDKAKIKLEEENIDTEEVEEKTFSFLDKIKTFIEQIKNDIKIIFNNTEENNTDDL